ncbi:hypothetical protein Ga0609869_001679 [Rhodovulum iodosum]|uniref:Uncharacterized protein n=1 Tax=Rhodovulum iodosum TaxID=68291 RepID=A0ABV3XSL6_9RHOB|nr:hypothetical protein [Rhodovulum robiginosum]
MIAYTLWRMSRSPKVPEAEKGAFQVGLPARGATPETAALAAGEDEAMPLVNQPDIADPRQAEP